MANIMDIDGISLAYARRLKKAGIRSIAGLLKQAGTAKSRQQVAEATGIETSKLLKWVNHADLFRIGGVGSEYADLLEAAGVDTVPELRQRNAKTLYKTLIKTNSEKHIVRKMPPPGKVEMWVQQAKTLPRAIEY